MTEAGAGALPGTAARLRLAPAAHSEEFARLYTESYGDVAGYCFRLLRDDNAARDSAQEAFVRLFSRWRTVAEPRAYVFVVATNLIRDEWKRRAKQAALLEGMRPLVVGEARTPDVELSDIVTRLPRRLRDVVVLHLVADLPIAEVARVVRIPEGTVKRRLHEARKLLRLDWLEVS